MKFGWKAISTRTSQMAFSWLRRRRARKPIGARDACRVGASHGSCLARVKGWRARRCEEERHQTPFEPIYKFVNF